MWNNRNDHRHGKSPIEPGLPPLAVKLRTGEGEYTARSLETTCSRRGGALRCGQIPCSLCSMAEISWIGSFGGEAEALRCCGNGCPGAGLALAKQGYTVYTARRLRQSCKMLKRWRAAFTSFNVIYTRRTCMSEAKPKSVLSTTPS